MFEHNDDITCLAKHENIIATGQIGFNPCICVWDCKTMEIKAKLEGTLTNGISHIAIDKNGKLLAASATDENNCIVIYNL